MTAYLDLDVFGPNNTRAVKIVQTRTQLKSGGRRVVLPSLAASTLGRVVRSGWPLHWAYGNIGRAIGLCSAFPPFNWRRIKPRRRFLNFIHCAKLLPRWWTGRGLSTSASIARPFRPNLQTLDNTYQNLVEPFHSEHSISLHRYGFQRSERRFANVQKQQTSGTKTYE